jgi:hypothetical protein
VSVVNSIFNFLRFNKKNWKAVVLCIVAATVFWIFNALNKTYSTNITFPLAFDYDQESFVPVKALPRQVKLNVSGLGWDLFRKSSGLKVPPLVIPLERPTEVSKIVGSTLPLLFSSQLEGIQINFVLTDTLFVDLDENVKRKFNLAIDSVEQALHPDYGLISQVTIVPDTVWIEGPKKIVTALPSTLKLKLEEGISKGFKNEEVELKFPGSHIVKRNPPVVEISFEIDKWMEADVTIPVLIINPPTSQATLNLIQQVNCRYRAPMSLANTGWVDSLRAIVDLKDLKRGVQMAAPQIHGLPKYTQLVKVDSVRITIK